MSGWRARIGLICPIGESIERAFNLYAPEGLPLIQQNYGFLVLP